MWDLIYRYSRIESCMSMSLSQFSTMLSPLKIWDLHIPYLHLHIRVYHCKKTVSIVCQPLLVWWNVNSRLEVSGSLNALTPSDRSSGLAERACTFSAIAILYGNREIDDTSVRYNHLRPITNSTVEHVCHETNLLNFAVTVLSVLKNFV